MMDAALYLQLMFLVLALTIISVVDLRTQTIPDVMLVLLVIVGLSFQAFSASPVSAALSAFFYFTCFWLIRKLHQLATGRIGLGFGDVKMAGAAGAWISVGAAPLFIGLAAVTALSSVALASLLGGASVFRQRIPFGPFLAISLLVCWLIKVSHIDLDGIYDVFSVA
jgi:leader peptidase (prepilin peptidase)/N-methyltransferase